MAPKEGFLTVIVSIGYILLVPVGLQLCVMTPVVIASRNYPYPHFSRKYLSLHYCSKHATPHYCRKAKSGAGTKSLHRAKRELSYNWATPGLEASTDISFLGKLVSVWWRLLDTSCSRWNLEIKILCYSITSNPPLLLTLSVLYAEELQQRDGLLTCWLEHGIGFIVIRERADMF